MPAPGLLILLIHQYDFHSYPIITIIHKNSRSRHTKTYAFIRVEVLMLQHFSNSSVRAVKKAIKTDCSAIYSAGLPISLSNRFAIFRIALAVLP